MSDNVALNLSDFDVPASGIASVDAGVSVTIYSSHLHDFESAACVHVTDFDAAAHVSDGAVTDIEHVLDDAEQDDVDPGLDDAFIYALPPLVIVVIAVPDEFVNEQFDPDRVSVPLLSAVPLYVPPPFAYTYFGVRVTDAVT